MKRCIQLFVLCATGCQSVAQHWTVSGSAYVESERPQGKAIAKIEVRYRPSTAAIPKEPRPAPQEREAAAQSSHESVE